MDIHEFANMLNGRYEGEEIEYTEECRAKNLGYIVVFGYSDDNIEFRGAINDEFERYGGGEIYLDKDGVLECCEDECKYWQQAKKNCKVIEALWCKDDIYAWTYKTEIPHATFTILDNEGNKFCKGMVFDIKELNK